MHSILTTTGLLSAAGALVLTSLAATSGTAEPTPVTTRAEATTFNVDLSHSNILFKCKHLGVSYQWGRFDDFDGSFTLSDDAKASSVMIEVDAASVNSNSKDRDDHLRGPDFFDVKQFPTMTFKSTKVEAKGDDQFAITGDLTLHGKTKEISFDVTKVGENTHERMGHRAGFEGHFVIQRADFGVSAYDKMLGADVTMHFAIEGIAKK